MWLSGRFLPFGPATASLCLTAITHTYLLFHCFPYIGYMSVQLLVQQQQQETVVTVDSVGWYAGLLGTAFTTGRCLSFYPWKQLRQRISVKKTLLLSLLLSLMCSIWFGISKTFASALLSRFCLGLSNTLSGCVKRIAIDRERMYLVKRKSKSKKKNDDKDNNDGEEENQRDELAPARVLAVMWWGSAIGPCLGGYLSNPGTIGEDTFLPDTIEQDYPFLLPNIVSALLCLISMITINAYITEEGHERQLYTTSSTAATSTNRTSSEFSTNSTNTTTTTSGETLPLLQQQSQRKEEEDDERNSTTRQQRRRKTVVAQARESLVNKIDAFQNVWKSQNTKYHLLAYWSFSFVVVSVDEGLPLFLIARLAGPGLSPYQIGWLLSASGLLVVLSQTMAVERILAEEEHGLGVYPSLKVASIMGNVPSVLVPIMLALNGGTYYYLHSTTMTSATDDHDNHGNDNDESNGSWLLLGKAPGDLSWTSGLFLILLMGIMRIFCSIYFALIGVATGRTVPPNHRDEVARIMTLGALCARAVAPIVAGALVSFCMESPSIDGAEAMTLWCIIGLIFGLGAAALTFQLKEAADSSNPQISNEMRSQRQSLYLDIRQRAQVFVRLWEVHYDQGSDTVGAKWRRLARKAIVYNRLTKIPKKKDDNEGDSETGNQKPTTKVDRSRRTSWVDHILRPGLDPFAVEFFILGTNKHDKSCLPHVLTPPLMEALHKHLPMSCSEDNYWLRYSLVRDGASMLALESQIVMSKNTFVAIETLEGDVFGCFMAQPWQRTNKYEFSGESFLWRMNEPRSAPPTTLDSSPPSEEALNEIAKKEGNISIYRWTGENEECQLLTAHHIAAGGGMVDGKDGFGIIVQDNLSRGSSGPCQTYGNPCLVSTVDGQFEVANMEVWAMTPFLFTAEAEQSQTTVRFIHDNMMNTSGDAPSSAQSAWTNFL